MKTKLLLIGGIGLVGSRVVDLLSDRFDLVYPTSQQLDVTKQEQIRKAILEIKPDLILYAAGFTNVDLAEGKKDDCYFLNVKAVEFFVEETSKLNTPFYYLSTDYVFDGAQEDRPYTEEDMPNPIESVYAKSKKEGELVTLSSNINGVIRLIMPFSAVHTLKMDIARLVLEKLINGEKLSAVTDQKVNPVFVDDLVYALGYIMAKRASGIYHVAATSFTTPYDFMLEIARQFHLPTDLITKTSFAQFTKTRPAKRPQHTWLDTKKFRNQFGEGILHTIEEEIKLFKSQIDSRRSFKLN